MRMWMIDTKIMCRQHLLGEHCEHHMFLGALMKGSSLNGYVDKNCLEFRSLKKRHDELVQEMIKRGYNHSSPLDVPDNVTFGQSQYVVDSIVNREQSLKDILGRCNDCKKLHSFYCRR